MRMTLIAALFVVVIGSGNSTRAQGRNDGNKVLDNCSEMVKLADDNNKWPEINDIKFAWCGGFIEGILGSISYARSAGTSLGVFVPSQVSNGQVARVLVNWLHNHPGELHRNMNELTFQILREAFPEN